MRRPHKSDAITETDLEAIQAAARVMGKAGGQKCSETHGTEFYQQIGSKGGTQTAAKHGHAFYKEIGRQGGSKTSARHGRAHYERMGQKGGQAVKDLIAAGKANIEREPCDICGRPTWVKPDTNSVTCLYCEARNT